MDEVGKARDRPKFQFSLRAFLVASVAISIFLAVLLTNNLTALICYLGCVGGGLMCVDFKRHPMPTLAIWVCLALYAVVNAILIQVVFPPWDTMRFFALGGPLLLTIGLCLVHFATPNKFGWCTWVGFLSLMAMAFFTNAGIMALASASV